MSAPVRRDDLVRSATIVASILLALFLGAAWEWLMDRRDEAEYVERLREEFLEGRAELEADVAAREATLTGAFRLLSSSGAGLPVQDDSLRALSAALIDFRYFTPTHPALDELIAGAKLELLRSVALRQALLGYIQERDRLGVVEERERVFVSDMLEPYLVEHIRTSPSPTPRDAVFWGPAVDRRDLRTAVEDPRFRNLMTLRIDRTGIALRFSRGLGYRIDAVLEELGGSP